MGVPACVVVQPAPNVEMILPNMVVCTVFNLHKFVHNIISLFSGLRSR